MSLCRDWVILGFQLFCVLVNAFCPSTDFEPLVRTFLTRKIDEAADDDSAMAIMAKCKLIGLGKLGDMTQQAESADCLSKIEVTVTQGNRAKLLTLGEIEAASVSYQVWVRVISVELITRTPHSTLLSMARAWSGSWNSKSGLIPIDKCPSSSPFSPMGFSRWVGCRPRVSFGSRATAIPSASSSRAWTAGTISW